MIYLRCKRVQQRVNAGTANLADRTCCAYHLADGVDCLDRGAGESGVRYSAGVAGDALKSFPGRQLC